MSDSDDSSMSEREEGVSDSENEMESNDIDGFANVMNRILNQDIGKKV